MSSSRQMVQWGSGVRSPSPRRSPSPARRSPVTPRSSSPRGETRTNSKFTPRTTEDLRRREAKVNRRRLQAEAKAHKFAMQQQRQELKHARRTQDLEYVSQHKETYGMTPTTKLGLMAGVAGVIGFLLFQQL